MQVRPYRAAGATRGSGLRRSAERQRERHAIRRRDVSRDTELETIPGVSQHHSLANDRKHWPRERASTLRLGARYALEPAAEPIF